MSRRTRRRRRSSLIQGSSRDKSYTEFRLHSYIPLQAGGKVGRTREMSTEVAYALVRYMTESRLSLLHAGLFAPPGEKSLY